MAVDKLVDSTQLDADLTSVANAIRTKGGTSAQLAFPADFVTAIGNIPSGGGYTIEEYLSKEFAGDVVYTDSSLSDFTLRYQQYITSISFPNVLWNNANPVGGYACANMPLLASFSAPLIKRVPSALLSGNTSLTSVDLSALTDTGEGLFNGCSALTAINLPAAATIYKTTFRNCTSLQAVDVLASNGFSNQNNFNGCTNLTTLVIRKSNGVPTLNNINNFTGTPFAIGGTGGTIYIPKTLYDALGTGTNDYKAASNWSTINGYGTITWAKIEGSYYETHYADGTLIPT